MNAFVVSSPLRERISQDIYDLQTEIGRDAARAYCASQLKSPRLVEKAPENLVQDPPLELEPSCDLNFEDFVNFPQDDWPTVELGNPDENTLSHNVDSVRTTTATTSEAVVRKPSCPVNETNGKPQRAVPVIQIDCALRKRLLQYLERDWRTLHIDGLFTYPEDQYIDPEDPERTRRLRDFSLLRALQKDDDLRYLRRAVALLRNLENFEVFHREAAHLRSCGRQARFQHVTDKQVAYNEYLAHIYAGESVPTLGQARQALANDLRFARRWLLLTDSLTTGAILVCGELLCKKVLVW